MMVRQHVAGQHANDLPFQPWLDFGITTRQQSVSGRPGIEVAVNSDAAGNGRQKTPCVVDEGQLVHCQGGSSLDYVSKQDTRTPCAFPAGQTGASVDAVTALDFLADCGALLFEIHANRCRNRGSQLDRLRRCRTCRRRSPQLLRDTDESSACSFGEWCVERRPDPGTRPAWAIPEIAVQSVDERRQPGLPRVAGPNEHRQRAQLDTCPGNRPEIGHVEREWAIGGHGSGDPRRACATVRKVADAGAVVIGVPVGVLGRR